MNRVTGTPDEEWLQTFFPIILFLTGVGCGAQLMLYIACVRRLCSRKPKMTRIDWFLLVFLTLLCCTNFIYSAGANVSLWMTFVQQRDYPGGPIAFIHDGGERDILSNRFCIVAYIAGNVLADGLLLWRCTVIWTSPMNTRLRYAMVFPGLMLVASLVLAILFALETSETTTALYAPSGSVFAVPYFSITLSLNILLTSLIVGRMISHQRFLNTVFDKSRSRPYRLLAVMFLESAALYAIVSICQLVTFGLHHETQQLWTAMSNSTQLCSCYLIVYRILDGSAWSATKDCSEILSMAFKDNPNLICTVDETETVIRQGSESEKEIKCWDSCTIDLEREQDSESSSDKEKEVILNYVV